jgi:hypothetical protein
VCVGIQKGYLLFASFNTVFDNKRQLTLCVMDLPTGLSEAELHSLLSLNSILGDGKVTYDTIRNVRVGSGDMLPPLRMMKLLRALHCFLRTSSARRFKFGNVLYCYLV